MLMIAGLGNPGPKHEKQRHNIGFMAVDEIHRQGSFSPWKARFQGLVSEGIVGGEKVLLIKPATFMNESGRAIGEAARFYKIAVGDLVVLYDELDLAPGKIRIKTGGGSGGHNGIRSIDAHLGKDYRRVRIGIGHPGHKDRVTGHVLGNFASSDHQWLDPLLDEIGRNSDLLAKGDDAGFMNRLALALPDTGKGKGADKDGNTGGNKGAGKGAGRQQSGAQKPAKTAAKGKSHIRQANRSGPQSKSPSRGPMAEWLKKLSGGDDNKKN